ncbi:hypothetical protein [Streptomyces venezuelae]|uniref:hypothetical protein n=1 Tax=Streptomyces venezuelae TaxID=54571 RepID=UPI0037D04B0B
MVSGRNRPDYIQGPNSDKLKFPKVLCANCNNSSSQAFDLAYEAFSNYLRENSSVVDGGFRFKFSDVYGFDWRIRREELVRYFVKHVGCRLAEAGIAVPEALIDFMNGKGRRAPHLNMQMGANLSKLEMGRHMSRVHGRDEGSLWLGDHELLPGRDGTPGGTQSFFGFDWFTLSWGFSFTWRRGQSNFYRSDKVEIPQFWPGGMTTGDVERVCVDCNSTDTGA